jgi:hypothetical protein
MSLGPTEPVKVPAIRFLEEDVAPAEVAPREVQPRVCAVCGAPWPAGASACPDCEVQIVGIRAAPKGLSRTFGIGTLMVIIAAVGITFAVIRELPVLGVVLGVHLVLAMIRTFGGIARAHAVDWPLSRRDKMVLGGESFGVAFLILSGAGLTFVLTMVPLGMFCTLGGGPLGVVVAVVPALTAAAFVAHRLRLVLWPVRFHRSFTSHL